VGLIGSKAKVKRIYDVLLEEAMPPECLARVHAPIGFDIGAVTPEEIAVSILAELIAVRRGKIDDPHVASVSKRWTKAVDSQSSSAHNRRIDDH
jgi:xanthine/CO dehydrogenase XdhC/CoxF family maturation factor